MLKEKLAALYLKGLFCLLIHRTPIYIVLTYLVSGPISILWADIGTYVGTIPGMSFFKVPKTQVIPKKQSDYLFNKVIQSFVEFM